MGEQKRYMLEERCLFLLALKKEQAIDEYYRQVGGGWLFLWHFRGNINFLPQKLAYIKKILYFCTQTGKILDKDFLI